MRVGRRARSATTRAHPSRWTTAVGRQDRSSPPGPPTACRSTLPAREQLPSHANVRGRRILACPARTPLRARAFRAAPDRGARGTGSTWCSLRRRSSTVVRHCGTHVALAGPGQLHFLRPAIQAHGDGSERRFIATCTQNGRPTGVLGWNMSRQLRLARASSRRRRAPGELPGPERAEFRKAVP